MLTRRSVLTSAAAIAAAPYLLSRAKAATPKDVIVMARAIDDVVSFDPAESYELTSGEVCGNLYRKLVVPDPSDSTKLIGDIAEGWEISPDGLTITIRIRKGIMFEQSNPLTAEDAAFSLQRVVKLNKVSSFILTQFGWTAANVDTHIKAAAEYTLALTLPEARSPGLVLSCLSHVCGGIVDKSAALAHQVENDLGNTWLKTHSAGAGPYRLIEWRAGDSISLETNPKASEKPRTPRIIIRHVADSAVQLLLLEKGDIDIARNLGADQLKTLGGKPDLGVVRARQLTQIYIAANMGLPQFQKPQVLEAVKRAIDYEAIAKNITPDVWDVRQYFLPSGLLGASSGIPLNKDPDKAKSLLREAGLPNGFSVTFDYFAVWPYSDVAQAVQADLAAVGIRLDMVKSETKQVYGKLRARQYEMAMSNWSPDYLDANSNAQAFCKNMDDSDNSTLKSLAWRAHYVDKELAAAVDAASKELDSKRRLDMYAGMQRDFLQRSPFAFLLQSMEVCAIRNGVSGLLLGVLPVLTRYAGIQKA